MTPDPITFLHEHLAAGRQSLVAAGIRPADAAIDVDLFARTILGWDRARVLTARAEPAPPALEPRFSEWILRRARREPSAYIVGTREFWGLDFRVTPDVLIPRPETEFIVEEALAILAGLRLASPRLADIGTGSGCLAVSLAREVPSATMTATDVSAAALEVARENARLHHVDDRVTFVETSFLDGIDGPFDLIAANPPYVKDGDKTGLTRDVRYEPEVALFGGTSGLNGVEAALGAGAGKLRSGGWLVMEFGFGQEDDVRRLVAAHPALTVHHVREDLQGIPRTAVIQKR
ncbi:MAG TPA: peptide chain release factor N(5)-glutamine methyltransferase [Vicinamibacterales bacterium]|nr:peptide chain release factor N(5)-glutamine methyltransferase [Vicinamibacterales bacterium]